MRSNFLNLIKASDKSLPLNPIQEINMKNDLISMNSSGNLNSEDGEFILWRHKNFRRVTSPYMPEN